MWLNDLLRFRLCLVAATLGLIAAAFLHLGLALVALFGALGLVARRFVPPPFSTLTFAFSPPPFSGSLPFALAFSPRLSSFLSFALSLPPLTSDGELLEVHPQHLWLY